MYSKNKKINKTFYYCMQNKELMLCLSVYYKCRSGTKRTGMLMLQESIAEIPDQQANNLFQPD